MSLFKEFPKISRWSRDVVITEKLDGTNACIIVRKDAVSNYVNAQSRNRLITPEDDNYGFAKWVEANKDFLASTLGEGYHYGEWWGQGIQRGYGLKEKKFSLFNVTRWQHIKDGQIGKEIGLDVVPILWAGPMDTTHLHVDLCMQQLEAQGSVAAKGFMNPEGIVIFHSANGALFKKTFEKDQEGKGNAKDA